MATVNGWNWMSGLDGTAALSQLSVPGSHESASLFGAASKCQNFRVLRQLVRGIRFLDIRLAYWGDTEPMYVYHSSDDEHSNFSFIQQECTEFLSRYGQEMILMNVQQTKSDADSLTFRNRFNGLKDVNFWRFNSTPQPLSNYRGKIGLVRACRRNLLAPNRDVIAGWDWPGFGLEWNGFAVSGLSWNDIWVTQNYWHGLGGGADGDGGMGDGPGGEGGIDGTDKGNKVEALLQEAAGNTKPNLIYLNFLSRADTAIGDAAADINLRIAKYIKTNFGGPARLGWLPIDFVGNTGSGSDSFEAQVIRQNAFTAGTSFAPVGPEPPPAQFQIRLSANGQPRGWAKQGSGSWLVRSDSDPVTFEAYQKDGNIYFKKKGEESYLSVSDGTWDGQVGFWGWSGASTFEKEATWLFSNYNGHALRVRSGDRANELWCGIEGELLDVEFVAA